MTAQAGSAAARLASELSTATEALEGLTEDRQRIVDSSVGSNADDEHDIEGSSIAFERAQVDGHLLRAQARVAAVHAALGRLEAGSYGRCVVCGQQIGADRLSALPATTTCIGHAAGRRSTDALPPAEAAGWLDRRRTSCRGGGGVVG